MVVTNNQNVIGGKERIVQTDESRIYTEDTTELVS